MVNIISRFHLFPQGNKTECKLNKLFPYNNGLIFQDLDVLSHYDDTVLKNHEFLRNDLYVKNNSHIHNNQAPLHLILFNTDVH